MIKLFVNVDHVATVREARKTYEPDPLEAAIIAEKAGAYGITAHLREDRRHVQDDDIRRLKDKITTPLNLEMAAVDEMIKIAISTNPFQVSIVPENRQEITTEGGLNILEQEDHLIEVGQKMKERGILFSLFVAVPFLAKSLIWQSPSLAPLADSIRTNAPNDSLTFCTVPG